MAYPTLQRDPVRMREDAYRGALRFQENAAFYAECAMSAINEGYPALARRRQDRARSESRGARNCVAELLGLPRDYENLPR